MRVLRAVIVIVVALGGLFVAASPASAQLDQVSLGQPTLGLEGATLLVPLTVVCDPDFNFAFASVSLAQSTGLKLAQGQGTFSTSFPGVPCTGAPQTYTVVVKDFSAFAFKQGKAAATVTQAAVFNPVTSEFDSVSVGPQQLRIRK